MTLTDFCEEVRHEIDFFMADWMAKNKDHPEFHPLDMDGAHWHDEFAAFLWRKDKQ